MVAVFATGFALQPYQNATALTSTMDCGPNCFDKVLDHLTEAQDEIDESDFSGLEVEFAKAKSLLNQLKQTTNVAGLEE
jgi:hypothetical protein